MVWVARTRIAFNFRSGLQIVSGVGVLIGVGPSRGEKGLIGYLSFEHPFRILKQQRGAQPPA